MTEMNACCLTFPCQAARLLLASLACLSLTAQERSEVQPGDAAPGGPPGRPGLGAPPAVPAAVVVHRDLPYVADGHGRFNDPKAASLTEEFLAQHLGPVPVPR